MINQPSHIIERVLIDVEVNSLELANELKENTNDWVEKLILQSLSDYFDKHELDIGNRRIQMDELKLEIDVHSLQGQTIILKDEFERTISRVFDPILNGVSLQVHDHKKLSANGIVDRKGLSLSDGKEVRIQSESERVVNSFLFFLEKGTLPWWLKTNDELTELLNEQTLSEAISLHSDLIVKSFKDQCENVSFVQRLNDQFSDDFKWLLTVVLIDKIQGLDLKKGSLPKSIFQELMSGSNPQKRAVLQLIIRMIFLNSVSNMNRLEVIMLQELKDRRVLIDQPLANASLFRFVSFFSALITGSVQKFSNKEQLLTHLTDKISRELSIQELKDLIVRKKEFGIPANVMHVLANRVESAEKNSNKQDAKSEKTNFQNEPIGTRKEEVDTFDSLDKSIAVEQAKDENLEDSMRKNAEESHYETDSERLTNLQETRLEVVQPEEMHSPHSTEIESNTSEVKDVKSDESDSNVSKTTPDVELTPEKTPEDKTEKHTIKEHEQKKRKEAKTEILKEKSTGNDSELVAQITRDILEKQQSSEERAQAMLNEEGFLASNGGLVMLNPFLVNLFKNRQLLNEENAITDVDRAVCLLHFLATGNEGVFEHHLVFEKYLCNVSSEYVVAKETVITKEDKEEAIKVLNAVCEHWKKMNSTSIELLRNEFLKRDCKVFNTNGAERVKVERKVFDILLDSLPWSIGMMRFPWKKEIIIVEW